jgi:hypothetical protein
MMNTVSQVASAKEPLATRRYARKLAKHTWPLGFTPGHDKIYDLSDLPHNWRCAQASGQCPQS